MQSNCRLSPTTLLGERGDVCGHCACAEESICRIHYGVACVHSRRVCFLSCSIRQRFPPLRRTWLALETPCCCLAAGIKRSLNEIRWHSCEHRASSALIRQLRGDHHLSTAHWHVFARPKGLMHAATLHTSGRSDPTHLSPSWGLSRSIGRAPSVRLQRTMTWSSTDAPPTAHGAVHVTRRHLPSCTCCTEMIGRLISGTVNQISSVSSPRHLPCYAELMTSSAMGARSTRKWGSQGDAEERRCREEHTRGTGEKPPLVGCARRCEACAISQPTRRWQGASSPHD